MVWCHRILSHFDRYILFSRLRRSEQDISRYFANYSGNNSECRKYNDLGLAMKLLQQLTNFVPHVRKEFDNSESKICLKKSICSFVIKDLSANTSKFHMANKNLVYNFSEPKFPD
jgi:hypothetical protein